MSTKESVTTGIATELIAQVHKIALAWAKSHMCRDAADDVAADVTMKMLRSSGRIDLAGLSERGELDRFIATAARNSFRSRQRSDKRRAIYEAAFAAEPRSRGLHEMSPEDCVDYGDLVRAVESVLEGVWPERQRIFLMVAESGMTYRAVGEQLGISPRKVEWVTQHARDKMRQHLAEYRAAALATRDGRNGGEQ